MTFEEIRQIEISKFHTSNLTPSYLAQIDGRFFEINEVAANLINTIKSTNSIEEAVKIFLERKENKYKEEDVYKLIDICIKTFSATPKKGKTFIVKFQMMSADKIEYFTEKLKFLFNKYCIYFFLVSFIFLNGYFLFTAPTQIVVGEVNIYIISGMFIFIILSSFIHELGHASACRHFKVHHGGIGMGLYLNFPVFYTDVSQVWRLKRSQRCIVNLAGVYFQIIILLPIIIFNFFYPSSILKYIIFLMNVNFLVTMNPFFKFDGYWMTTDILGIANLREKSKEILMHLLKWVLRKDKLRNSYLFCIDPKSRIAIMIYSLVVNFFFGFYFFYIIPLFWMSFINNIPELIGKIVYSLSQKMMPDFAILQQFMGQILFALITIYFAYKIISPLIKKIPWKKFSKFLSKSINTKVR